MMQHSIFIGYDPRELDICFARKRTEKLVSIIFYMATKK
jgi:hypothetical protein